MANRSGKQVTFQIDNASGAITNITSHLNQASVASAHSTLEDTALGDDEQTFIMGVAGASASINGYWNTTTRAIFAPLMGNRTGVTKTIEFGDGIQYLNGEAWVTNVQVSGQVNTLQTFSVDLTVTGAMNNTAVMLS